MSATGDGPATSKVEAQLKRVRVISPSKLHYDSPARSVSAENDTGPFDVLPGHKNFISLLKDGNITVRASDGHEETIAVTSAIMHVSGDVVQVFLDV